MEMMWVEAKVLVEYKVLNCILVRAQLSCLRINLCVSEVGSRPGKGLSSEHFWVEPNRHVNGTERSCQTPYGGGAMHSTAQHMH